MREISHRKESDSREGCKCKSGNNASLHKGSGTDSEKVKLIKLANTKIRLLDVLTNYGFKIEKNYQKIAWSQNIKCPFPSHKGGNERTPSFGYSYPKDIFYCFGCHKAGKAVEFISLYEEVPRIVVAENILSKFSGKDDDQYLANDFDDNDKVAPILFDLSKFVREKIKEGTNNIKYIEKLLWWFDLYLLYNEEGYDEDEIRYRANKVKELLSSETFNIG